jgi:hypothetical protein
MTSFRDRFLTPAVARSITSPSAIVAAGAGAAAGVLAFGTPLAAVGLAVGAVAVRVLAAVPRPRRTAVDPRSLDEPWRSLALEVADATRRFERAVSSVRPGPLRDRLDGLGRQLAEAVDEAGRTAGAGHALSNGRRQIDTDRVRAELAAARSGPVTERTERTVASLQAQLDAADRLDRTIWDTHDRLRLLDARIDETVTRAVELSVTQGDLDEVSGLGSEVDAIVSDLEALRQAAEETRGLPGTGTSGAGAT